MKDKVICDLAETYRIYDYRSVPVPLLATLVSGLGPNSRVGMELDGRRESTLTIYVAELCDMVEAVIYGLAKKKSDADRASRLLLHPEKKTNRGLTIEEYDALRKRQVKSDG